MSDNDREAAVAGALFLGFIGVICLTVGIGLLFGIGWALVAFGATNLANAWLMGLRRNRNETLLFANNTK